MATDLRLPAALLIAAACAGCTVGPESRRPDVDVAGAWSGAGQRAFDSRLPSHAVAGSADGRRWWTAFRDPVLDRLVEAAMAQNIDLQTASLRIAVARAQRDAAAGGRYPSVAATGVAGRARMSENGISQALAGGAGGGASTPGADAGGGATASTASAPPSTFNLFQAGFDATWEIDLFGKVRRGVQASEADVRSAGEARRDAQVSIAAEVARAYLALRGAEQQLVIVEADIATQTRIGELVASRERSGLAASPDVAAQRAEIEAAEAQRPRLEQQIAQGRNRLALLLALPPGALESLLGPAGANASPPAIASGPTLPPEVPVGLPGDLLRRRPDIRQREADVDAETARIGVATASLFPSIRLGLAGGLQATRAADLFDWSSRFLLGGSQLTVPIFQGGQLRAQVRIADLRAQQAVLAYRQAVLGAFHDVDNALVAYAAEQRRAASLLRQRGEAKRRQSLAESRYRSGLAAFVDVLDAERQSHRVEIDLADSTAMAATDLVAVFKALGGGWEDGEGETPP